MPHAGGSYDVAYDHHISKDNRKKFGVKSGVAP